MTFITRAMPKPLLDLHIMDVPSIYDDQVLISMTSAICLRMCGIHVTNGISRIYSMIYLIDSKLSMIESTNFMSIFYSFHKCPFISNCYVGAMEVQLCDELQSLSTSKNHAMRFFSLWNTLSAINKCLYYQYLIQATITFII